MTARRVVLCILFPLSEIISSTWPYSEIIDSKAEITFLPDSDDNNLNIGNF